MPSAPPESASRQRFRTLVAQPEAAIDLAEAALLIACEEYPQLDVAGCRAHIQELGAAAEARRRGHPELWDAHLLLAFARGVARLLQFVEQQFPALLFILQGQPHYGSEVRTAVCLVGRG